ncbi:MAG: ferredoxin [Cyclobacteriaceae bacterium]|nr:ferredoxin [Cyclobacteriaceae bacterium]
MKTDKEDTNQGWSEFFNEGQGGFFKEEEVPDSFEKQWGKTEKLPSWPEIFHQADSDEINKIRKFFLTGIKPFEQVNTTPIFKIRGNHTLVQDPHSYPIWIANPASGEHQDFGGVYPFYKMLEQVSAHLKINPRVFEVVKNMLTRKATKWIENHQETDLENFPQLIKYLNELPTELGLKGNDKSDLEHNLGEMIQKLPEDGWLLFYSENIENILIRLNLYWHFEQYQKPLINDIKSLTNHLTEIVEQQGSSEKSDISRLQSSLGKFGELFDMDPLAGFMPDSASQNLPIEKLTRIQEQLKILANAEDILDENGILIDGFENGNAELYGLETIKLDTKEAGNQVKEIFLKKSSEYVKIIKSYRIAKLEEENLYESGFYDPYFEKFQWDDLTREEKAMAPPVLVRIPASKMNSFWLSDLLNWINQHLTLRVFVFEDRPYMPGQNRSYELGMIATACRNAFVCQSTGWYGDRLFQHLQEGFKCGDTAVFYLFDSAVESELDSETALFARVFPHFCYLGRERNEWGERFVIEDNPEPENEWVSFQIPIGGKDNKPNTIEYKLTPVDYLYSTGAHDQYFLTLPLGMDSPALLSMDEYLKLSEKEKYKKIPYVLVVDEALKIRKMIPHRVLVMATDERADFWNTLLDLAGKKGFHKTQIIKSLKQEFDSERRQELEKLAEQHEQELREAESKSMEEAMDRLTSALLDMDMDTLGSGVTSSKGPRVTSTEKGQASAEVESVEQKGVTEVKEENNKDDFPSDPYIDTALCTSCNECIQINKSMFKYNGDKLAEIVNPDAGTFADLVEAAEKCPAGVIHPGKPRNMKEPDIEKLMEIAKKYN